MASYLPPLARSSEEVEEMVAAASPGLSVPRGFLRALTGVGCRRHSTADIDASDLAAQAGARALAEAGVGSEDLDLLIFASASQDMVEPATANLVQLKLGATCPVFDLKNACNSFINALAVADALIQTGAARKVLVTTGETPSRSIKWSVSDRDDLKLSLPGYTLGDAGAAALLVPGDGETGIFHRSFQTVGRYWDLCTLPGGGSRHPRGDEFSYFQGDGNRLRMAFGQVGTRLLFDALEATGTCFDDYARILVHQVSESSLNAFLKATGVPAEKVVPTLADFGNMASATLPMAFSIAAQRGQIRRGDDVLWIGLAAGISIGIVCLRY